MNTLTKSLTGLGLGAALTLTAVQQWQQAAVDAGHSPTLTAS